MKKENNILYFFILAIFFFDCTDKSENGNELPHTSKADSLQVQDSLTKKEVEVENQTTEEDPDLYLKKRATEEEQVFSELGVYDGEYYIYTESEGVDATIQLKYLGEKQFSFHWKFKAMDFCDAELEGVLLMDRTRHGFIATDDCVVHLEFRGEQNYGLTLELLVEDSCKIVNGECIFSGIYTSTQAFL